MLLLLTCWAPSANGLDLNRAPSQLTRQFWSKKDGLPADAVWALHVSAAGYLWIGTDSGLVRFDGARFTAFSSLTHDEFLSDEIRSIDEGPVGTIWVGTVGGGLIRIRANDVARFDTTDGLSSNVVYTVYVATNGDLWLGTASGVCRRRDDVFRCFGQAEGLRPGRILIIEEDHAGTLWFAGLTHGLSTFDGAEFRSHKPEGSKESFQVLTMIADPVHNLLLSTYKGRFYGATLSGVAALDAVATPDNLVAIASLRDSNSNVFLGAQNGQGLWQMLPNAQRLNNAEENISHVLKMAEGQQEDIWVGTTQGLYRYRSGPFVPWGEQEGLAEGTFVVEADEDNNLWVGTDGDGLFKVGADGSIRQISAATVSPSNTVPSLMMAKTGTLWASTFGGGVAWLNDGAIVRVLTTDDGLASNQITSIYEDANGAVWLGSAGALNRWADGSITHTFTAEHGLSNSLIRHIEEDHSGRLLLSGDNGLLRFSFETLAVFDGINSSTGLVNDAVATTYVDGRGVVWIGGRSGGLARLDGDRLFTFTAAHGLGMGSVMSIVEDEQAHLWLGGRQGIVRVSIADLDSVAAGKAEMVTSRLFTKEDGLRATRIPGGYQAASARTSDGRLWFATGKGVATITPKDLPTLGKLPPVLIEGVRADGISLIGDPVFRIPANTQSVQIDYSVPQLTRAEALRFRYRLKSDGARWRKAGDRRTAFFSSMAPRTNVFEVGASRAGQPFAFTDDTIAAIELFVEPLWHQTYVARMTFSLLLLALFWAFYRLALSRSRNQQQRLEVLVGERTTALTEALDKVELLSRTDPLTGVANRRHFEERLATDWRTASAQNRPLGIIMIDIDHFKQFNDAAGHQEGDRCLRSVAQALHQNLRENDFVARYGGEEFTVLLTRSDVSDMHQVGQRLQGAVSALNINHPGLPGRAFVTVSAGFATTSPATGRSASELLRWADAALYKAKAQGRNRLSVYQGQSKE